MNAHTETQPGAARLGRWRWVLLPSLALNLLVLGLLVGVLAQGPDGRRNTPSVPPTLMSLVQALPDAEQSRMREAARKTFRGEPRDMMRSAARQTRQDLITALQTDVFDRAAVETILTQQRDQLAERYSSLVHVLLDTLENMTSEKRQDIAETLSKPGMRDRDHSQREQ